MIPLRTVLAASILLLLAGTAMAADGYDCLIEPHRVIRVGTPVEGIIAAVAVDRGDMVRQGQELARLESDVETAGLAVARARAKDSFSTAINRAKAKMLDLREDRTNRLYQRGHVSDTEAEEVTAEAEMARLAVSKAELDQEVAGLEADRAETLLAQRVIRSPVDGVVTERALSPGEYRTEQSHVVTVAQLDPLNVEVFVPVSEYGRIAVGGTGVVVPQAPVGGRHEAKVTVVDRVFDAASGTFGVRLELPNQDARLPAGLRCTVSFAPPDPGAG